VYVQDPGVSQKQAAKYLGIFLPPIILLANSCCSAEHPFTAGLSGLHPHRLWHQPCSSQQRGAPCNPPHTLVLPPTAQFPTSQQTLSTCMSFWVHCYFRHGHTLTAATAALSQQLPVNRPASRWVATPRRTRTGRGSESSLPARHRPLGPCPGPPLPLPPARPPQPSPALDLCGNR